MSTCLWYDEDFEEDRAHQSIASGCTKEATHHSCCWVGDASKPNVCEEHKCRCAAKMAPLVEVTGPLHPNNRAAPMPSPAPTGPSFRARVEQILNGPEIVGVANRADRLVVLMADASVEGAARERRIVAALDELLPPEAGHSSSPADLVNRCFGAALEVVARDPDVSTPGLRRITDALAKKAAEFTPSSAPDWHALLKKLVDALNAKADGYPDERHGLAVAWAEARAALFTREAKGGSNG